MGRWIGAAMVPVSAVSGCVDVTGYHWEEDSGASVGGTSSFDSTRSIGGTSALITSANGTMSLGGTLSVGNTTTLSIGGTEATGGTASITGSVGGTTSAAGGNKGVGGTSSIDTGTPISTGGTLAVALYGPQPNGGTAGKTGGGGTTAAGGTTGQGGMTAAGGVIATGGAVPTGGTSAAAGNSSAPGGNKGVGGTSSIDTGTPISTGGTQVVFYGVVAVGGTSAAGGAATGGAATGGVRASGGASLTGGTKTAGGATSAGGSTSVANGVSTGDTHLLTFDGAFYHFQAAGEFVLTSDGDGFTVQVRQEPWTSCTTVNTAVAIQAGSNRIAFYARKPNLLRINGQPTTMNCPNVSLQSSSVSSLTCTLKLIDNYVIAFDGTVYSVKWPESARAVEVTPMTGYLNISVWDSPGSPMLGLLGDGRGNPRNDLKLADETALAIPVSFDDLYSRFAGAWRVHPEQSLFYYDSGESTQSFTRAQFPPAVCDASTLPAATRMNARQICQNHGISEAPLLDACTLDVAMFGNADAAEAFTSLPTPVLTIPVLPDTFESPNDDN